MNITAFNGEYRFLSNFYPCKIRVRGLIYPSAEHAYQACKTLDMTEREKIRKARSAGSAKRLGKTLTIRLDWEDIKIEVMRAILKQKFNSHPTLRKLLLDTDNSNIIEVNVWNDTFWGECNGIGENHLGKLLMEVREYVRTQV